MRIAKLLFTASTATVLCGCGASLPNVTTGSLFGGAQPSAQNDYVSRTLGVSATSARAVKCGFNFDPAKLRSQFLSVETAGNPADADKLGKIYDTGFNGVTKAIAANGEDYCTADRTARIKEALTRHLAGDYTPPPPEGDKGDGGLFSGWGSGSSSSGYQSAGDKIHDLMGGQP